MFMGKWFHIPAAWNTERPGSGRYLAPFPRVLQSREPDFLLDVYK